MKKILFLLLLLPLLAQAQLELPFGVKVLNPEPLDALYYNESGTPYASTAEATTQIPSSIRYIGQTVNVNNVEYWFEAGTADVDLVEKGSGSFWKLNGTSTLTGYSTIDGNGNGVEFSTGGFYVYDDGGGVEISSNSSLNLFFDGGTYDPDIFISNSSFLLSNTDNSTYNTFLSLAPGLPVTTQYSHTSMSSVADTHIFQRRSRTFPNTPLVGFGSRLSFRLQNAPNGAFATSVGLAYQWSEVTPGAFDGKYVMSLHINDVATDITEFDRYGWRNLADYSASWTPEHLVTKAYVDAAVGAGVTGSGSANALAYWDGVSTLTYNPSMTFSTTGNTLTVENLDITNIDGANTIPYFNSGGNLGTKAGFEYDDTNDILYVERIYSSSGTQTIIIDEAGITSTGTTLISASTGLYLSGAVSLNSTPTNNNAATDILARNPGTGALEYRSASSLTSSPAGSDTQIQFNNAGAFGAEGGFEYNSTTNLFTASTIEFDAGEISRVTKSADIQISSGSNTIFTDSDNLNINSIYVSPWNTAGSEISSLRISTASGDFSFTIRSSNGLTAGDQDADDLILKAGNGAASGNGNGGDVIITAGTQSGSGTRGYMIISNIPTSSAGLPSGAVWSNAGVLTIVP